MNIEVRTDKNIQGGERLISYVRAELMKEFQRYSERITHFLVYIVMKMGKKRAMMTNVVRSRLVQQA